MAVAHPMHINFSDRIKTSIKRLLTDNIRGDDYLTDSYKDITEDGWPKRGAFGFVHKMSHLASDRGNETRAVKVINLNYQTDYNARGINLSRQQPSVRTDSMATYDFLMACQESVLQSDPEFRHINIVKCYESWILPPQDDERWNAHMDLNVLIEFIESTQLTEEIKRCLAAAKGLKFHIAMDLYSENLHDRYNREPVPSRSESKSVILQISRALAFIHSKGYVHRDIKPMNVLITVDSDDPDNLQVAIGDFGLCKRIEEGEEKGAAGTRPYNTAPDDLLDVKFDVWSLGVLMFEIFYISEPEYEPNDSQVDRSMNGLVEYARKGDQSQLKKFIGTKVKPKAIKKLVVKCLQRSPEERVSAAELENQLEPMIGR